MSAFSKEIDVSAVTSYPTDPQIVVPFDPDEYLFMNKGTDATVFFSFDGQSDHGELLLGVAPAISWRCKTRKAWVRRQGGVASTKVRVSASTDV